VRLRLFLPRRRGGAGLSSLRRAWPLAAILLGAALLLGGCGGSHAGSASSAVRSSSLPSLAPSGPAFGLTEDNADLLWNPAHPSPSGGAAFASARERLTALHPSFVRLLVDWAALQPDAKSPPALEGAVDGCARGVTPCGEYRGIAEELAAVATQQRVARSEGRADFQVVLDLFGAPSWAARAPSGCEAPGTQPFSRPISAAGLAGYRQLIRALLALGSREGVQLSWWSPWNEPNNPQFLSPQRASCSTGSRTLAPAVYAELAQAMDDELDADGAAHHLLLGELAAYPTDSVHRASVASFVAALPASVVCLSDVWSIHAYASFRGHTPAPGPVAALEQAIDARGGCGRAASVWVTETGAGAPHPGQRRGGDRGEQQEGCLALARQVIDWSRDARVGAIFQYTFREDPAFPVGLLSADLSHVYPAYDLFASYARTRARGERAQLSSAAALCA
jgi:hypothetical protein